MDIGKQIRHYRLSRSARQEELADFVGVSAQAVSKWETGASLPDISLLPRIATYLGIAIDALFQVADSDQMIRIKNAIYNQKRIDDEDFRYYSDFLMKRRETDPGGVDAYILLAQLYNHRAYADHKTADGFAKEAVAISPDSHLGWAALIEANGGICGDGWLDNHFSLIEFAKEFYRKHSGSFHALRAVVLNMIADGRLEEAEGYIDIFLEVPGREYMAMILKGDIFALRGDMESALNIWNVAVDQYADIWQVWCDRADRMRTLGRYAEALEDYESCYRLQQKPRLLDGLHSKARLFEQIGMYVEAIAERERIIANLSEDYGIVDGQSVDDQENKIARLKSLIALKR